MDRENPRLLFRIGHYRRGLSFVSSELEQWTRTASGMATYVINKQRIDCQHRLIQLKRHLDLLYVQVVVCTLRCVAYLYLSDF